ncbi:endonuclease/exonuclease/phosphatase family protein [Sphingomonas sp.]|uniref:endonuclease/exonuclease/phosphatase family protein n=1 Tax=Sphingomonas sp. TaxID=28214 RepID=UPI002ED7873F
MSRLTRRTLLAAAAALPAAACAPRAAASRAPLRVATFNIWHDAGNWPVRLKLIVDVLRATDADVIALQEVLQDSRKSLPNQAETIAAALGGYAVHFMSTSPEGAANRYGNAILSRLPVSAVDTVKLEPLDDYRTAIRLRVDARGQPVDIVNTHLAWKPDQGPARAQQIRGLLDWLPQDEVPLVLMGDFNAPLDEAALAPLAIHGLDPALPPGAVDTTLVTARGLPARVIDHIFVNPRAFAVRDARRIGDVAVDGEYPSDHFGVAATLVLR